MRSRTSSHRLCAIAIAAFLLSCSPQTPAGDGSTETPPKRSTQHVLEKLVATLLGESGGQAPVEPEAPATPQPPYSPEPEPGLEDPAAVEICPPDTGPVTVLVLPNVQAVSSAAAQYAGEPIIHRDAETVIFESGRVITSQVEKVSDHLNRLGWSGREMKLLGSMPQRYAFSDGSDWRSGGDKKQPRKKRRRRRG